MKNYYKILEINQNASTDDVKNAAKKKLEFYQNSNDKNKKSKMKDIAEAYQNLYDYHKRKEYDNKLKMQNFESKKIVPIFPSIFSNNFFNDNFFSNNFNEIEKNFNQSISNMNLNQNNKSDNKNYFYSSSTSSNSYYDKNGNRVTEIKTYVNDNGKKDGKQSVTKTDKNGDSIIKDFPLNPNKNIKKYYIKDKNKKY